MKFTIDKDLLSNTMDRLSRIATKHPIVPLTSHVLIDAQDGQVDFSVTDLAISERVEICDVDIEEPGVCCVDCHRLAQMAKHFASDTVELSVQDKCVTVLSGKSKAKLFSNHEDDFPSITQNVEDGDMLIPCSDLLSGLSATKYAISNNAARRALNGAQLLVSEKSDSELQHTFMIMSTNGAVASFWTNSSEGIDRFTSKCASVIPTNGVMGIIDIVKPTSSGVSVGIQMTPQKIHVNGGSVFLSCQKYEEKFPNYKIILDPKYSFEAEVSSILFRNALRRSMCIADDVKKICFVGLTFDKNTMYLDSIVPSVGEFHDEIPFALTRGYFDDRIQFDPRLLLGAIEACKTKTIALSLSDANQKGRIGSVAGDGFECVNIVMPIRK